MRASKIRTVARFEFMSTVTRKGYLIVTFGMPLFVLLYGGLISFVGMTAEKKESEVKIYGVVDHSGVLDLSDEVEAASPEVPGEVLEALAAAGSSDAVERALAWWDNIVFRPFDDDPAARSEFEDDSIRGYYVIPEDYVATGEVAMFTGEAPDLSDSESRRALGNLLLERLLAGRVSGRIAERVRDPISRSVQWTITDEGTVEQRSIVAKVAKLIVPILFAVLLLISLMASSGSLLQGTAVEKENRVVEVLLSSAGPDEILTGKLIGLGATGLLQIVVWFGMVAFGGILAASTAELVGIEMPWAAMGVGLLFFLAGYLFIGSLMLGTGSLGSNARESQQLAMIWSLPSVIPLALIAIFIADPHGTLPRVLTWIPFTAPVTAVFRMTLDPPPGVWLEVAGAYLVLLAATWLALRFGARLFRVGLLLTGTRPKLREILRQARLSARR